MHFLPVILLSCGDAPEGKAPEGRDPAGDRDGDGFSVRLDCDDGDAAVNPAAAEVVYDGADNDCDAATADDDLDSDGFVLAADCDDSDPAVSPAAQEVCDEAHLDEDCDGLSDDSDGSAAGQTVWYVDADGDGYGSVALLSCDGAGLAMVGTDCDDGAAAVSPAGQEVCDGADVDEDCDGLSGDADSSVIGQRVVHPDADGDGFGDQWSGARMCEGEVGWTLDGTDWDDGDSAVWFPPDFYVGDLSSGFADFCIGYSERNIEGDLILDAGQPDIRGLSCVREITQNLLMRSASGLKDLSGLDNLERIGKDLSLFNIHLQRLSGLGGLREVGGTVLVESTLLVDLSGLERLEQVGGTFYIGNNAHLQHLSGLDSLETISDFSIESNDDLIDLSGLNQLREVEWLTIRSNNRLQDLSGLEHLELCNRDLTIYDNSDLRTLSGLEQLERVGENVYIEENNKLLTLEGIEQLRFVGNELNIINNDQLKNTNGLLSLESVCDLNIIGNNNLLFLSDMGNIHIIQSTLFIGENNSLRYINGLQRLQSIQGNLVIWANPQLIGLDGLSNVLSIFCNLSISSNGALETLRGLSSLTRVRDIFVFDNAALCSTEVDALVVQLTTFTGSLTNSSNIGDCP